MQMQEVVFETWMKEGRWPAPKLDMLGGSGRRLRAPHVDLFGAAGHWLSQLSRQLDVAIDPLGLKLLVAVSASSGPDLRIQVHTNWEEPAILWGAHVSSSPAMQQTARRPFVTALRAVPVQTKASSADGAVGVGAVHTGSEAGVLFWDGLPRELGHTGRNGKLCDPKLAILRDGWNGHSSRRASGLGTGVWTERSSAISAATDRDHLAGALKHEPGAGFLARFLYVCDHGGEPDQLVRCDDEIQQLIRVLRRIHGLRLANDTEACAFPKTMPLSDRAYQEFEEWRLASGMRFGAERGILGAWTAHMHSQVIRIATALEMLEWAFGTRGLPPRTVEWDAMDRAISLMERWLVVHMRHAFGLTNRTDSEAYGSKLADWICRRRPPFIKPSVLLARRKVPGIRTPEAMNAACQELAEMAWMAPVTKVVDYRATFMVNSRLLEILSEP